MKREELYELIKEGPLFLDGATGTNLQKAGMPPGVCPEKWLDENPSAIIELQREYVRAGSQIVYAPTFSANRVKLGEFSLENELKELNRRMVELSREACKDKCLVAGDISMTGHQLYPLGDMDFEELVDIYKEQISALCDAGVDLLVIETMMSLAECRAAVIAAKEVCDLAIMVSLTYNDDGRTLFGSEPEQTVIVLQNLGADVIGINCGTGPEKMIDQVKRLRSFATVPILVKPNAGIPRLEGESTVFPMGAEEFAGHMKKLVEAGAAVIGGCCGTTPKHIRETVELTRGMKVLKPDPVSVQVLSSERAHRVIDINGPFQVIGERINPTGKKKLQAELLEGSMDMVLKFAREQEAAGAAVLDVNMGMPQIDEKQRLVEAVFEVTSAVDLPLCIDSSYPEVIEAALRVYPGRALINSISAEEEKMKALLPIAKKYGAMFILLPLDDEGLPKTIQKKHECIHRVLDEAKKIGIEKESAIVDLLVSTVGADADAAKKCFATARYCKEELRLPTVCGLSNISFGLPQRIFVNTAFFTMAITNGLTMAIANPSQELLMYTAMAADMLLAKSGAADRYLDNAPSGEISVGAGVSDTPKKDFGKTDMHPVFACVVNGEKDRIVKEIKKELDSGAKPGGIIDEHLIPAINQVGKFYEEKVFFLPQLISGANAMKAAMDVLEPLLDSSDAEKKETIVFATVEGDIHDIGKNLVVLMLKNYGYDVIDLGKDIPAGEIVDAAIKNNASVIGLSALMTTTMMKMKEVVELAKERGCKSKIIIGGACVSQGFAETIGADGYSADAAECIKLVERLMHQ